MWTQFAGHLATAARRAQVLFAARNAARASPETHVAAGFGKFVEYQTRNVAEGIAVAFPEPSNAVEKGFFWFVVHSADTDWSKQAATH